MKKETDYTIVRANTLQDLDKAFSCGLIKLYQDIFADQPYEEYFSNDDVISMFYSYFESEIKNSLVLFAYLERELIAFCMAVPFNENWLNFEIIDFSNYKNISHNCYEYFKKNFDSTSENTWYLDDLGVKKDKRRRGVARHLLKTCLVELNSKNVFLRTSDSNNQAQLLYQNLGFHHLDGLYTQVSHKRLDGSFREDRRIIMLRQVEHR
ncbi:GNAT family N-acetyltransferase [Spirulina sp. CCNP1310]|uniref:GNAT family N-acetyltransferase n=1 Tax=Spirulina sp. CCNP1310 TaxID=3110249 RepID=UPI002B2146E8|nr:GNAT family N-acetyltransferase [Spirulina sp. CCNP1310]MEA5419828.1 GNAT family N-acetyltransferase [Spirulina sp. CCNP1310]